MFFSYLNRIESEDNNATVSPATSEPGILFASTINAQTLHIAAQKGDFKTVLMPVDPLRTKFIAEKYLVDPVLVNNVC